MSYCCVNCFKDTHIIQTIKKEGIKGDCDFCSSKNVPVIDISSSNPVSEKLLQLIQAYTISDNSNAKLLKESLRDDWSVFNLGCESIQSLVKVACSNEINESDEIYSKKVIIEQLFDEDFQHEYGLFKGLSWKDFSDYIKYINRFHNAHFNADSFASILSCISQEVDSSSLFYRARICDSSNGFEADKMFSPPKSMRRPGRINPEEICVLYLSSDKDTVLYETRANVYDYITIGTFKAKRPLKIANLSGFSSISPFIYGDEVIEKFAINRNIFNEMAQEIAKPIRRNDSPFEYLPTQFIAEFIKSQRYDGVAYESTINKGGYNFALFDESLVECIEVETTEIVDIKYRTKTN